MDGAAVSTPPSPRRAAAMAAGSSSCSPVLLILPTLPRLGQRRRQRWRRFDDVDVDISTGDVPCPGAGPGVREAGQLLRDDVPLSRENGGFADMSAGLPKNFSIAIFVPNIDEAYIYITSEFQKEKIKIKLCSVRLLQLGLV